MANIISTALTQENMDHDSVVTRVADLRPSVVHRVIRVKILRRFHHIFDIVSMVQVILVDIEGVRIHATIGEDCFDMWSSVSAIGSWIQITNFRLSRVVGRFRPTLHEYKIHCNVRTKFENIPSFGGGDFFAFVSFRNILEGLIDTRYCVDVIARIVRVNHFPYEPRDENRRDRILLLLEDEEGLQMKCRLMNDYYRDFVAAIRGLAYTDDNDIGILTMQFAKLERYRGELWLRPTRNCTVVDVNRTCAEVSILRLIFANRDRVRRS